MHNQKKIVVVVAIVMLLLLVIPKVFGSPVPLADSALAVAQAFDVYGRDIAEQVEKIFRLETSNFTSYGYYKTKSAGMQAYSKTYPYGWNSLKPFWDKFKGFLDPIGTTDLKENGTGKMVSFIVFRDAESGMHTLGEWLMTHEPGEWYSNNPADQKAYEAKLANIDSSIVDTL